MAGEAGRRQRSVLRLGGWQRNVLWGRARWLQVVADGLGESPARLSIARARQNPAGTMIMPGASSVAQRKARLMRRVVSTLKLQ
ncbi:hypothetical protein [Cupriavidus basilensis]|uniref:hypothetical protein n=1 Tax=Cupriavidus basilensis TaxID=68895 RepID=UPI00157B17A7|nr:hypothetical protein [Cupriavidus basilensis]NUA27632.1 hypothetical protein [Cupriavidus basilensis]